jgi:hypothetical protein
MFASEHEMSVLFEKFLRANFGNAFKKEYQGLFGIPDFLCYEKNEGDVSVISFELKLTNWKKAAKQAFRHKSFSNIAYVVLDTEQAWTATNQIDLFHQYNIGLAFFDSDKNFDIFYKPIYEQPYSLHLNQKIRGSILNCRKKWKNFDMLVSDYDTVSMQVA